MGKFFDYKTNCGSFNMSFDEKILKDSINELSNEPVLRFYGWSPACISLGRNQKDSIDYDFCKKNNIDVVRRATGGRALFHDKELTYSFVCPVSFLDCGESVILSYKEISQALIIGMSEIGIKIDFPEEKKVKTNLNYCMSLSTGADLSYKGKKIIGSAQGRKNGYILQHGSVLIDLDMNIIKKLFHEPFNASEITFIKNIDNSIKLKDLVYCLKTGFENKFNQRFI